ncbi:MAG: PadR family transcriptional regulator [Firmicutes bacterium]|nr:PadR family transcriptional regulator [Bacillota bacterium]
MKNGIKRFSPLTEATYYILLSLSTPLHGYGVIKNVEEISNGRLILAAGTLYGALSALLDNKLIISVGEDEINKRRKTYKMTDLGRELIYYEIKRMQEMVTNGIRDIGGEL